ncbi:ABC transporter ATP-binding protein [Lentilactobacillus hilgardii]|uniref:ABC transporter, ATP-binding protein n=1 Tax=Lentilactobacillus hilgardii (strain ATCC 8290 / DSM 20176 / CCUG 30140 / JCM 1155 / KCTC 3500 / NBRC 15886 / NCIMB 8040 / NRRL B-1843 / 9) TaxID=1423757 RepID=C0XH89_LENH9|nr:ATP-binding cassette domain-containing protein [Lentilactobacillus hilgardii]EEI19298.1 ABC transporter, ATP-binding protein [Lentilactobacillus buchneri ATCC 11577]EEI25251.1 ABC transporter, ATP-binding protein [Lentilactobacillus hilgardii DSM 20176 = ATCC 8290]KRK59459.1 oligopeptide ABC superfamily ATP binding cassette transporter, ATP-binding protein [Lentilactobacillus hilgardii DSM 20176 = ATCC 8290]MCT3395778.1 ABC transporter ATP-binding protein [Lentilactobacillus hilgardii]QEU39
MIDYSKAKKVLQVEHLKQYFNVGKADEVRAVDDITFDVYQGETFGLVGESGSGKTTTGRAIIHLYEPTSGKILFKGEDVSKLQSKAQKKTFRRDMQMIFQDPYASLNPRMKVKDIVAEGIDINHLAKNDADRTKQVEDLLETVGLNRDHSSRYPHEFSGGQRQRIGIARALAVQPEFIIADEPISALDVSIQAQVVNLLKKLQRERDLTYLFIAHDLSMVKYISDRIGVMHYGRMLEIASSDEIYAHPLHDYTASLLSAVPVPDPEYERARQQIPYDPSKEFDGKPRQLVEIVPNHWVRASEDEIPMYKERARKHSLLKD